MIDNIGGVNAVLIIPKSNLVSMPDVSEGALLEDIEFADASANFFIQCWENGEMSQNHSREKGNTFETEIKVNVAAQSSSYIFLFEKLESEPYIVIVTDNNNVSSVIGAYSALAVLSTKYGTGRGFSDLNGYEITIQHRDRFRVPLTAQVLNPFPTYALSGSGVIRPSGASAGLVVGPGTLIHALLLLSWLEAGAWRFGQMAVLKDGAIYQTSLDESAEESVAASGLAPSAALVSGSVVVSFVTTDVEIIYYKIVNYVA